MKILTTKLFPKDSGSGGLWWVPEINILNYFQWFFWLAKFEKQLKYSSRFISNLYSPINSKFINFADKCYKPLWHVIRFPWWLNGEESACSAGNMGLIPGVGRSPGEGNGYPLQYSCLENPMDRGAWWGKVHWVTKVLDTTEQLNNNMSSGINYTVEKSEVTQSCPTLCNPMDCSPPGSSVHGIFQARVLEWVAISFSILAFIKIIRWISLELT